MLLEAKYSIVNGCKMTKKNIVEIFTKGLKTLCLELEKGHNSLAIFLMASKLLKAFKKTLLILFVNTFLMALLSLTTWNN